MKSRLLDANASAASAEEVRELLSIMDEKGIAKALVHLSNPRPQMDEANRKLVEWTGISSRLLPCFTIDTPETVDEFDAFDKESIPAFWVRPRGSGLAHLLPAIRRVVKSAAHRHIPVFLDYEMVHWSERKIDWGEVESLCAEFENVSWIVVRPGLADGYAIYDLWQGYDNLYIELSYYQVPDGITDAVGRFGAERLIFGSGLVSYEPECTINGIRYARIDDRSRELIGGGNLARILGLDSEPVEVNSASHGFRIFDVHGHIGPERELYSATTTADGMIPAMDRCGVEKMCISSMEALQGKAGYGHKVLVDAVMKYPGRIYGYAAAFPETDGREEKALLAILSLKGIRGIKMHCAWTGVPMDDPAWRYVFQAADERKLPILIHGNAPDQELAKLCESFPGASIILAHMGAIAYADASPVLKLASRLPNLYVDTAGSVCHREALERLVETYGSEKILFGSDYTFLDMGCQLGRVLGAKISDEDKRRIFYDNAVGIFQPQIREKTI